MANLSELCVPCSLLTLVTISAVNMLLQKQLQLQQQLWAMLPCSK